MRARLLLLLLAILIGVVFVWMGKQDSPTPQANPSDADLAQPAIPGGDEPELVVLSPSPEASGEWEGARVAATETPRPEPKAATEPNTEHPVQGRLLGPAGEPVAGAEIWITQANSTSLDFQDTGVRTAGDGGFSLKEPRMRVFGVLAVAEGFGGALGGTYSVRRGAKVNVELSLATSPSVAGQVLWEDGRPAPGATIEVFGHLGVDLFREPESEVRDGVTGFARVGWATTDPAGKFRIAGLPCERLRLRATSTALDNTTWMAFADPVAAGQSSVELRLRPLSSVEIAVTDDRGVPVPSVRLRATPLLDESLRSAEPERKRVELESPDGVFSAKDLFAGQWRLEIYATGHWPRSGAPWPVVSLPTDERISVGIWRAGGVGGQVLGSDGSALGQTEVRLWSDRFQAGRPWKRAKTDDEGRYLFENLDPGANYTVESGPEGDGPRLDFSLTPGELLELAPLSLAEGGDLLVKLRNAQGEPWVDRPVALLGLSQADHDQRSDELGQVHFRQLPPGRVLVVTTGRDNLAVTGSPSDAELARAEALVVVGQTAEVELQERLLEETTIAGILRVDGAPAPGKNLSFLADRAMLIEGVNDVKTDEQGRFRTKLPHPGRYRWFAGDRKSRSPSPGADWIHIPRGGLAQLELSLATGSLEVTTASSDGVLPEWMVVVSPRIAWLSGMEIPRGALPAERSGAAWVLNGLVPGDYLVRAVDPSGKRLVASQEVTLAAGERQRVVLQPMALAPAAVHTQDLVAVQENTIQMVQVAVWGSGPELLAAIPGRESEGVLEVHLPVDAKRIAVAQGEKVGVLACGPPPWTAPFLLHGVSAGRIQIDRRVSEEGANNLTPRVIDGEGHNWARVPAGVTNNLQWMSTLAVRGRWTSPPLPPGTYTVEAEGMSDSVEVRANEFTFLSW